MGLVYSKSPYLTQVQCVDSAVMLEIATIYNLDLMKKKKSLPFLIFAVCTSLQLPSDVITFQLFFSRIPIV